VPVAPVAVRGVEPADLPEVQALSAHLGYLVTPQLLRDNLAALSARADHLLLAAVAGGRVCGWICAARVLTLFEPAWVEVEGLVVAEDQRGQGAGAALLRAVEAWAEGQRVGEVQLGCRITRTGAHRFYERMGYRVSKTQHRFVRKLA
jgi:GNAT superfamily N-acetyltransferase